MSKECKNPTCSRPSKRETYCSRVCQVAMRTLSKGRQIPDMWVGMDTYWALVDAAEAQHVSLRDFVASALEMELEKMGQLTLL